MNCNDIRIKLQFFSKKKKFRPQNGDHLSEFIIKDCVLQANPVDGQRLVAILRVVPPGAIEILPWWMGLSLPSKYGTPDVESQRM